MKKYSRHIQHFIPLIGIFVAGILGFMIFSYDTAFQFAIATAVSAAYISWGLVHHYLHDDLHTSVILEYVTIAILGLVVMYSLLLRA